MPRFKIFLLMLLSVLAASAQVRIDAPTQATAGSTFAVTLTANGTGASIVEMPNIPKCKFVGSGTMTRIVSQIVNGKQSTEEATDITLTFLAQEEGTTTIPPIKVKLATGKIVSTPARKINITNKPTSAYDRTRPVDVDDDDDGVTATPSFGDNDVFVRIITDKRSVYEQEPIVATIKLYSRLVFNTSFQLITQPTFEGFLSEEVQVANSQGTETIDGQIYNTFIVKRCVLYPQKAGELKVTSGTYEITLVDLVSYNTGLMIPDQRVFYKTIRTNDKTESLKVLPLPEPRPATFDGAVGQFSATADLQGNAPRTNEPLTYTVEISGKGNVKYLKTPKLNLPPGLDQYTPKTNIEANVAGGDIVGTYTATYTIVPQEVGHFNIPPLTFTYFDPSDEQYHSIDLHGYDLDVAKGDDVGSKSAVEKMTDIHHIHPATRPLVKEVSRTYLQLWYWAIYLLLAIAFIVTVIVYRRNIRLNADVQGRKLARAMRVAMKRFKSARALMRQHKPDEFYTEINRALFGYLSDKLAIPASQLVRENIASQLCDYGLSEAEAANVISILDDCEMARFTPMGTDAQMSHIYDNVVNAVKSIENAKQPRKQPQQSQA